MDKPYNTTDLNNGIRVEFFSCSNRYFGDFHRVKINAVATIPILVASLPDDLQKFAASLPDCIKYEKSLERMGVTTDKVEAISQSLINDFLKTARVYLEKSNFAECLLRRNNKVKSNRTRFRL